MKNLHLLAMGALVLGGCKPQRVAPPRQTQPTSPWPSQQGDVAAPSGSKVVPVAAKVRAIVAEQMGISVERVSLLSTWKELGADSLDHVELIMAFEEEFDLEIPDAQAEAMKTVGDAVAYVRLHRKL